MLYTCSCIVHVYDGISTRNSGETLVIEADNEEDAKSNATNQIRNKYKPLSHLGLSGVSVTIVKKEERE